MGHVDEVRQQPARRVVAGSAQSVQPGRIVGPCTGQARLEHALHFGEAGKPENLAEPDHGRWLHLGGGGGFGHGGKGDPVRFPQHVIGTLAQPLGQAGLDGGKAILQALEIRRGGRVGHGIGSVHRASSRFG